MKIVLAAVGRLKDGPERALAARYAGRVDDAGRGVAIGPVSVHEIAEGRGRTAPERMRAEADALRAKLPETFIALDERGRALSSQDFAERIGAIRDGGAGALGIVIGGPDGLDPSLREAAALTLAFGPMTWPHQIVRVLAAEQLYRAVTILAGHPYHRA